LRVSIVNGAVKDEERYDLRERFAKSSSEEDAIDIIVFTEVGSEGLDYQFCNTMVNYDLPWNPMRIEQRIGRIDRRGQTSEVVHIYNCLTDGTIDADIFDRCLTRIGIFEQNIGECSEILGELAEGIEKIIIDNTLTAEQRKIKLEKLADNEVANMVELQRLENEAKELFGIDISDFTNSLDRAENPWLSAVSLRRLVEGYLEDRLSDGRRHLDGKRLTLSAEAKALLREDYNSLSIKDKTWQGYLRSGKAVCAVAFEQDEAKRDPKTLFISATHPLARQAARHFADYKEMAVAISVASSNLPIGVYAFALYAWEFTGERPQVKVVSVCENEAVQGELQELLQSAVEIQLESDKYASAWIALEKAHLQLWKEAVAQFKADTQQVCKYKSESLTQSHNQRLIIAENRPIENIRAGEIANLKAEYAAKLAKLRKNAEIADIHATLLVKGAITIQGEAKQ
jgi:hypothetical protein